MDILSVLGILLGVGALLLGNMLDGGQLSSLVNVSALIIVFGGTIGATLVTFSTDDFYSEALKCPDSFLSHRKSILKASC